MMNTGFRSENDRGGSGSNCVMMEQAASKYPNRVCTRAGRVLLGILRICGRVLLIMMCGVSIKSYLLCFEV